MAPRSEQMAITRFQRSLRVSTPERRYPSLGAETISDYFGSHSFQRLNGGTPHSEGAKHLRISAPTSCFNA